VDSLVYKNNTGGANERPIFFSNNISIFLNKLFYQQNTSHIKINTVNLSAFIHENAGRYGYILEFIEQLLELFPMAGQVSYSAWTTILDRTRSGVFSGVLAPARSEAPDFIFPAEALGGAALLFFPEDRQFADLRRSRQSHCINAPENADRIDFVNLAEGTETNLKNLPAGRIARVTQGDA
jgi:hypothetical protein